MNLIDLIFPKGCLGCNKPGKYLCLSCISMMSNPKGVCSECTKPSIDGFTHVRCQKKYGIDGLLSIWNYEGVVRKAVLALKYKYATDVATELAHYLAIELKDKKFILDNTPVFVPIPLHWYRENNRGFNQSYILGKAIANTFNWQFATDLLIRKKHSLPQVGLKGEDRNKNIKDVFELNPLHRSIIAGSKSLVLFDDVYTTGSTIKEAVKVLKRNGAEKVWGLTVTK